MHRLTQHSQPTTPSTADPFFERRSLPASAANSTRPTPTAPRHSTPSSPIVSRRPKIEQENARGRTPYPHFGRSISEPRSSTHLAEMGGDPSLFSSHQIPGGALGLQVVARGRPRSATTTFERMSLINVSRQSRSYPHSRRSLSEDERQETSRHAEHAIEGEGDSGSASGPSSAPNEADVSGEAEPEERDREVVRVNLGLRGLGTVGGTAQRRGRRGRSARGRGSGH